MSIGRSPGTSEISSVSTRAGWHAGSQPAALDGRKMPTHAVHLADGGAARQQRPAHGLFEIEGESRRRQRQQGRAAARYQAQHQVVFGEPSHLLEHALRGVHSGGIRHGMRRFDDLDTFTRHA